MPDFDCPVTGLSPMNAADATQPPTHTLGFNGLRYFAAQPMQGLAS